MKSDLRTGVSAAAMSLGLLAMAVSASAQAQSQTQGAPPKAAPPPPSSTAAGSVSEVVVTAQRLNQAREAIQPQIGASTYTLTDKSIQSMPGGEDVQLNQVILQAPGVSEDSYGQVHVRGEHNGLQYRLDGVILPEGLSVFSQSLDPQIIKSVSLITGSLPAEYGLRTGGVIDITTKSGLSNGGSVSLYGGQRDEIEGSLNYHGSAGTWTYFVNATYLRNDLGIESPDDSADPLHDKTSQLHVFAYAEDILSENSRIAVFVGSSDQRFQIPDLDGAQPSLGLIVGNVPASPTAQGGTPYPSQDLNEAQREFSQFAAVSYLYDAGRFTGQASLTGRYSTLTFTPDELGDLLYDGISQYARKSDTAADVEFDGVYRATDQHTVRFGLYVDLDRSISDTVSQVMPENAAGMQVGGPPYDPITLVDDETKTAATTSVYVQDEWKILSALTLNYGLRFDQFNGYRDENQLSPRANLVWKVTPTTTFHMGYSRYFSPPPFELIGQKTLNLFNNTSAASPASLDTTPYAERANYYDIGVSQKFGPHFTFGVDSYFKDDKNVVDEGQFGAPIILTPFNYAVGHQRGIEVTATYSNGPLQAYANFAAQSAKGKDIISSQFNFSAADLAYIANNYINLDHSATYTASAGFSYAVPLWRGTSVGADANYGSGLRADLELPDGGDIPNGLQLPSYIQVNLTASHRFQDAPGGPVIVRLDVINVADRTIELRNGSGVGVFAPQFGPRQGVFAGITKEF